MAGDKPGPRSKVPKTLWPELQRMERENKSQEAITAWLNEEQGIEISRAAVCRTLAQIRKEAPPALPDPELEPATDLDEVKTMRTSLRQEMRTGAEWRQRHSAAGLLLRIMEAQRELTKPTAEPPQPGAPQPETAPTRQLTPEEEAAAVAAQLGKRTKERALA